MSNGEIKKVSRQDIQLVQNLIERCLQLYMNQEEVIRTLLHQAKIEPGFTELVWQKLEEENQDFFRAYHLRLMLKDQIERFNDLLERQIESMQMYRSRPIPMLNGSHTRQERDSTCQATGHAGPNVTPENVQQPINTNLYPNGIKSEAEYSGNFSFLYGTDTNALEPHPGINNPAVSSFSTVESNSQPSNENVLNADTPSFGFLGQIPRNFSLSDLTADFSNSSEILESYSGSAFLARDINNFLDPQDIEGLDTVSEGLSFEDFASD